MHETAYIIARINWVWLHMLGLTMNSSHLYVPDKLFQRVTSYMQAMSSHLRMNMQGLPSHLLGVEFYFTSK